MNPKTQPDAQSRTSGRWGRLAWLPIPLLVAAILVLKALDCQTAHESQFLLMLFNFFFSTLASLLVVVLFGRSFLARGTPEMLLFGCGILLWGAAGTFAPALLAHGINVIISFHNILLCLSAFCQLAGAILLLNPRAAFREAGPPLAVAYIVAIGMVWMVAVLALNGRLPVFFVQGEGGTTLRHVVLGLSILMFACAATLLWVVNRRTPTVFVRWYGQALLLVTTGLFGIMIESVHGGALSWTGRAAQFLGGAYMLIAALASVRESGAWTVALSEELEQARKAERASVERYRMLFKTMTDGFALHEIITDDAGHPCDYRFLDVNPAFERLTGLKRADLIGRRVLEVLPDTECHWIENYGKVALTGEPLHMENYSAALKRWFEIYAYRTEQGSFAVVFSDVTGRKQTEEALADAKNKLEQERDILQAVMDGAKNFHLVYLDRDFNFVRVNETYAQTCGYRPEQMIGKNHFVLYPNTENKAIFTHARDFGESVAFHDKPFEFPDQPERSVTFWDWTLTPVKGPNGQVTGLIFSLLETTDRKRAEDALRNTHDELATLVEERTRELREKEVLLKEIHHRVKNNLQVISSLVGLQADVSGDETVREVLRDVTCRVRSMALVHEKLYQSPDLARIDFAEYVRGLLNYLWRAHGSAAATVRLTLDLEPISLPVDTAVPCGLILNELAGNALKHAFRGRFEGEVTVSLQGGEDGRIRLNVADNGVGLPAGLDWRQANSLGLRLVQLLSGQLGADVEVSSGEGTCFEIIF